MPCMELVITSLNLQDNDCERQCLCSVLSSLSLSKQVVSMCHSVPVLRVEEWPIPGESLTDDTVRALIDRVNSSARGGVRFVGSVLQQAGGGGSNGRVPSPRRGYRSPPHTPPCTPPGEGELEDHSPTYSPGEILVFSFRPVSRFLFPSLLFSSQASTFS